NFGGEETTRAEGVRGGAVTLPEDPWTRGVATPFHQDRGGAAQRRGGTGVVRSSNQTDFPGGVALATTPQRSDKASTIRRPRPWRAVLEGEATAGHPGPWSVTS